MTHTLDDFTYRLPVERIAQFPANPRESAKLMIVDRENKTIEHTHIRDFPEYLTENDVLIINNTKVFKARLHGITTNGTRVEIFLVRPTGTGSWSALGKPGKKIMVGDEITVAENFKFRVLSKSDSGILSIYCDLTPEVTIEKANTYGEIPVPPYIKKIPTDGSYQTVYASSEGSVAAPTAGFHLTDEIIGRIKKKGIQIIEITLHVGIGTFMPIKSATLETHAMHSEWVHVTETAASQINKAKLEGKRIIAIGTTTTRTLEGVAQLHAGSMSAYTGDVTIFIKPGYAFQFVNALFTNFHLPKSTLLVLVSAFASTALIQRAYKEAIENNYRFYSFGDAMLLL